MKVICILANNNSKTNLLVARFLTNLRFEIFNGLKKVEALYLFDMLLEKINWTRY